MANYYMHGESAQRRAYEQKYKTSRMNLLLVVIFTAINLVLLVTNTDVYFLFAAFVPYYITSIGMLMCGRFPEEFYTDGLENIPLIDNSYFSIFLTISVAILLFYLLAWKMSSKNRVGWLIFILVFFVLDTLGLLVITGFSLESIFDILFHAWVLFYLILGISAHYKLKKLAPEKEPCFCTNVEQHGEEGLNDKSELPQMQNSFVIREADKEVKHRVLLQAHVFDYEICYRRVKHTNELVINGKVYDEIVGVMDFPHMLKAWIDGHFIAAGYTGTHSIITVDEKEIAKKIRIF